MTHYLYEKAWECYRIDDCMGALGYLSALSTERPLLDNEVAFRNTIQGKIAHLKTPEDYLRVYEFTAAEQDPAAGGMAPIAYSVWRVQWVVSRVSRLSELNEVTSLVDIGCQKGQITTWLARQKLWRVVGVDIAPTNIRDAKTNLDNVPCISYQVADAEDLPFDDGEFDASVIFSVLEHVRHPDKALSEALRVTRDGGYVFGHVPYGGYAYWTNQIAKEEGNEEWLARPFQEHVRLWDPHEHLRYAHMEIEWNELTGDKDHPFACRGERAGEWCFMIRKKGGSK
jgi:2-polyprenyl-3-methyl-5-hydroxy-6-metoxy-1,4-benzoquinol methylase